MSGEILVIGDSHIGLADGSEKPVVSWLERAAARRPSALYLNGDLFHYLIAHPKFYTSSVDKVFAAFKRFRDSGIPVHYVEGNRDFFLKGSFVEDSVTDVGLEYAIDAGPRRYLIVHGDMAVVLDEYGGASGIVSLENITEELFGQIQDEFDRERPEIEPLGNGRYRVRGDYLIEDLADRLKIDVGEPAEETIGGYVQARLGREVHPGDRTELGEMAIEVVEAERYRVRWVILQTRMPQEEVVEEMETMS